MLDAPAYQGQAQDTATWASLFRLRCGFSLVGATGRAVGGNVVVLGLINRAAPGSGCAAGGDRDADGRRRAHLRCPDRRRRRAAPGGAGPAGVPWRPALSPFGPLRCAGRPAAIRIGCRPDGAAHGLSGIGGQSLADGGWGALAPLLVPSPDEQALLVEGIRRGDPSAEERLIVAFQRPVLCMLVARTRDPEASRDLAQEALMAALRAIREGRLRQVDRLAGFMAGTARNLALKYQRSRRADPLPLERAPEPAAQAPGEEYEAAERVALVEQALNRLENGERRVLELTWLEGLEPREIAGRLGLSGDVVRARKSRALRKVVDYVRRRS